MSERVVVCVSFMCVYMCTLFWSTFVVQVFLGYFPVVLDNEANAVAGQDRAQLKINHIAKNLTNEYYWKFSIIVRCLKKMGICLVILEVDEYV